MLLGIDLALRGCGVLEMDTTILAIQPGERMKGHGATTGFMLILQMTVVKDKLDIPVPVQALRSMIY